MNEQAIQDAYNLFVQQGYKKSVDDFKQLIGSNPDALNDSYNLFVRQGYTKSIDDYKTLLGVGAPVTSTEPVKKKGSGITALPSEDIFSASQKQLPSFETTPLRAEPVKPIPEEKRKLIPVQNEDDAEGQESYWSHLGTRALSGITSLDKMVASIPEAAINILSIPQNAIAWATGLDIAANADTFKKTLGISNPILDKLNEEEKRLQEKTATFNKQRYESSGIADNIIKGNYGDAFQLLGSNIVESVPVSLAMMMGGATLAPAELVGAGTIGFLEQNREQLAQDNPNMSEVEKTIKALGMAASETVFESVGTGTIGQVYKDIVKKEGFEAGKEIFKNGLVDMYKGALKKYGAPIGLLGEGVEEAATQITQNVISGKPVFDGVADSFITGAGSGVVFAAPITAVNAKKAINNTVETYQSKAKINNIIKDKEVGLDQIYNVPIETAFTPEQIEIANTNKSRDILVKNLERKVKDGDISQDDAKQSLYVFDKVQQVSNNVKDLEVSNEDKAQIATLLSRRNDLATQIQNKDDVLVIKEKQEIADINKKIQDIILTSKPEEKIAITETPEETKKRTDRIAELETLLAPGSDIGINTPEWTKLSDELQTLKTEQDAIQKQATDESVLRAGEPKVGLPKVGEGDQGPQVIATGTEAKVTTEGGTEEVKPIAAEPIIEETVVEPAAEPVAEPTEQQIVDTIVQDQTEESQNEGYEYTDLYNQDPRLAALQSQKDMLKFTSGQEYVDALIKMGETQESAIERQNRAIQGYTKNINALDNSLKVTPAAEPAIQPTATPVVEPIVEPTIEPTVPATTEEPIAKTTKRAPAPSTTSTLTKNAMKSFKSIFPNVPVKTFKNMKEMRAFVRKELGDKVARGLGDVKGVLFSSRTILKNVGNVSFGRQPRFILLNEEMRSPTTLPHEIWHALLAKAFNSGSDNKALFKKFRKSIDSTFRKNGYNELADKLNDFADQPYYKRKGENAEEWLVQLGAYMTESGFKVGKLNENQKTVLGQLKDIINKYAIKLFNTPVFLEEATADNILEFITTISDSLRRGEDLNKYFKESKLATATSAEINDILNADIVDDFESTLGGIRDIVAIGEQKNTDKDILMAKAIKYLTSSDVYKNADDIQKEEMYRQVRDILGLKQKSAPSVTRLKGGTEPIQGEPTFDSFFGKVKKGEKITMTEKQGLYKQIKDLARGAKDAKKAWVEVSKDLAKGIKELITKGTITTNQAKNVISKMSKVNMFSKKSVDGFLDYMSKVFENAEYAANLDDAKKLRKDIKKLSKNKDKNANVTDLARRFSDIDPSMVEDINEYNEIASKVKQATKGSTIRGEKVSFADAINIEETNEYINETMEAQDKEMRKQKAEEIQELMGIDASELSYEQMMQLLESEEPITKYNESVIRDTINKMFDLYSAFINDMLENNEDIDFTDKQKDLVKRFMDMNLNLLTPKEALEAVDALSNFMENGSTARMESVLADYTGEFNSGVLVKKGIKASPISKYWSTLFGRYLAAYTTNLNILFEKMFKGFNRGGLVEDLSGVTKIKRGNAVANRISNQISNEYVKKFFERKANGEAFNTAYNSIEREVIARSIKNIPGTKEEIQKEFERRKTLIKETIAEMEKGDAQEVENAALVQKAYDKLLKDSNSADDVKMKADKVNMEAVDFWIQKWSDVYDDFADISLNVYNKILERDTNYTPDRYVRSKGAVAPVDFDMNSSAFHSNNNSNNLYKKESGVLMKATRPTTLPKNMYLSMSFDKNMANSMHDALVDVHTAIPIRQAQSFLNSDNYRKIVPDAKDAKLLADRISLYVQNIRKKNPYANDELSDMLRNINKIANIGVGQALGGITQPFKQMIPVAMNTLINAGSLDLGTLLDQGKNGFIDRSGYEIANRGVEAQAQIESLNKIIEQAAKSKGAKAFKLIEDANKKWLDIVLVKPDVFIARASWITYYEQSLKKQGIDPKTIDYNTHEVNEKAADYAQRMVDRQQNISDADLAGKMFVSKQASTQILVKLLMPFASFRMNQSARLGADLAVLSDNTASIEDRKIAARSLAGFAAEMLTFKMISAGTIILLGSLAKLAMGKDEDEEEKKKRIDAVLKGQRTSMVTDMLSPIPVADKAVQAGSSYLLNTVQNYLEIPKEEQFSIYGTGGTQEILKSLGMFGIAADRAAQLLEVSKLAATGEYTDSFGKEKTISEKDRQALLPFVGAAILSNVGLAPTEVSSVVKYAVKDAKTKQVTPEQKAEKARNLERRINETNQKIQALENIRETAVSDEEVNAIDKRIRELKASPEEKKQIEAENKQEANKKRALLTDPQTGEVYDNESELKRYNPELWYENFGIGSDWYESHRDEEDIKKKMNKEIRRIEDEEKGYSSPKKKVKFGPQ